MLRQVCVRHQLMPWSAAKLADPLTAKRILQARPIIIGHAIKSTALNFDREIDPDLNLVRCRSRQELFCYKQIAELCSFYNLDISGHLDKQPRSKFNAVGFIALAILRYMPTYM